MASNDDFVAANAAAAAAKHEDEFQPFAVEPVSVPGFVLTAHSVIEGALFNRRAAEGDDAGTKYPVMTGSLRIDNNPLRVPVAGFLAVAEQTGLIYLQLSIGPKNGPHYRGRLFPANRQREGAPDYFGYVSVLPVTEAGQYTEQEWQDAPQIRLRGFKRRNQSNNSARIALLAAPAEVGDHELPI